MKALMKMSDKIQLARANPIEARRSCHAPAKRDKLVTVVIASWLEDVYLRTIEPVSMHTRAFVPDHEIGSNKV